MVDLEGCFSQNRTLQNNLLNLETKYKDGELVKKSLEGQVSMQARRREEV